MIAAALLCGGFTAMCCTSHAALATTFGGLLAVTITLPPLLGSCNRLTSVMLVTAASVIAVGGVWLFL